MKKINSLIVIVLSITQTLWAQSNWQHVGPKADLANPSFETGRAQCIAVSSLNPSNMYIGQNGGVWMTSNGGTSWSKMDPNNFMYYSGASDIIISPTTGNVLVASTDLSTWVTTTNILAGVSYGIYNYNPVTTNWSLLWLLPTSCRINHIQFYPGNEQIIYACTSIGLYRTTNGGTSWTLIDNSADINNIAFISDGAGGYFSYITGNKIFKESSNGVVFTTVTEVTNLFTWTNVYADLCVGNTSGNIKTLYILAAVKTPGSSYQVLKFTKDVSLSISTCIIYSSMSWYDNTPDRLAIAYANNGYLFWGGVSLVYHDTNVGNTMLDVQYPYPHADQHDLALSGNQMLLACDGGVYKCNNYTSSTLFTPVNSGLHIAQVNGFSGASDQPDTFFDSEQDTKGFRFSAATGGAFVWSTSESNAVIVDKFNNNLVIGRRFSYYTEYSSSTDGFQTNNGDSYCYFPLTGPTFVPDLTSPAYVGAPFYINTLFQDPGREKIYYGTNYLAQWEPISRLFLIKLRMDNVFSDCSNPLRCCGWVSVPISMAISPNNKNALVFTTAAASTLLDPAVLPGNQRASQVIQFYGPDIDNSWAGNNENLTNWRLISPNLNNVGGNNLNLTNDQIFSVIYNSIVISPWDKNKIWVSCSSEAFSLSYKVLVYDGTNWNDYSNGIPVGEVVKSMVMENGSNDGIYLGTNRGMYYRNALLSAWEPYMANLPHLKMNQLEINYKENTVRAGTYGRGIWKSNLNCPGVLAQLTAPVSKGFFEGNPKVSSVASITANGADMVYYRGTDYVELLPGFNTATNSNFLAYIHECNASGNSPGMNMKIKNPNAEPEVIDEITEPFSVNIYPNPNQGIFSINIQTESTSDVSIYDLLGRLVLTKNQIKGEIKINLDGQPAGIYIVKALNNSNGKVEVKKIIFENSQY